MLSRSRAGKELTAPLEESGSDDEYDSDGEGAYGPLGGLAARPEGFVIFITTHSDEPPAGVFKDKLAYFRDVRDGVIDDPTSMAVLYEWPAAMLAVQVEVAVLPRPTLRCSARKPTQR